MSTTKFAGRRGEITWPLGAHSKSSRCYDAFVVDSGFMLPFKLGELVHVWYVATPPKGEWQAIRLRPDPGFRRRVMLGKWCTALGILFLAAGAPLWLFVHTFAGPGASFVGAILLIAGIVNMFAGSKENARTRDIRLILGKHVWGSSDPGLWPKSIRPMIADAKKKFGVESYAELARQALRKEQWAKAMWAARLLVALGQDKLGEQLTDEILAAEAIQEPLEYVRGHVDQRANDFDKPMALTDWITGDPRDVIIKVD